MAKHTRLGRLIDRLLYPFAWLVYWPFNAELALLQSWLDRGSTLCIARRPCRTITVIWVLALVAFCYLVYVCPWPFGSDTVPGASALGLVCLLSALLVDKADLLWRYDAIRRRIRQQLHLRNVAICINCGMVQQAAVRPRCPACDAPLPVDLLQRLGRGEGYHYPDALAPGIRRPTTWDYIRYWPLQREILLHPAPPEAWLKTFWRFPAWCWTLLYGAGGTALLMAVVLGINRNLGLALPERVLVLIAGGLAGGIASRAGFAAAVITRPKVFRRIIKDVLAEQGIHICGECGYLLRGLCEARCPECGALFPDKVLPTLQIDPLSASVTTGPQPAPDQATGSASHPESTQRRCRDHHGTRSHDGGIRN